MVKDTSGKRMQTQVDPVDATAEKRAGERRELCLRFWEVLDELSALEAALLAAERSGAISAEEANLASVACDQAWTELANHRPLLARARLEGGAS